MPLYRHSCDKKHFVLCLCFISTFSIANNTYLLKFLKHIHNNFHLNGLIIVSKERTILYEQIFDFGGEKFKEILNYFFFQVPTPTSLWKWIDDILLPGLYNVTWYNGREFEYSEGFISNKQTFLMGMPRLRQLRIKPSKLY